MENELMMVIQVITELSEQLVHNQKLTKAIQSQAGSLKVCLSVFLNNVINYNSILIRNRLLRPLQDLLYVA